MSQNDIYSLPKPLSFSLLSASQLALDKELCHTPPATRSRCDSASGHGIKPLNLSPEINSSSPKLFHSNLSEMRGGHQVAIIRQSALSNISDDNKHGCTCVTGWTSMVCV